VVVVTAIIVKASLEAVATDPMRAVLPGMNICVPEPAIQSVEESMDEPEELNPNRFVPSSVIIMEVSKLSLCPTCLGSVVN
jgi:hypothetical protein